MASGGTKSDAPAVLAPEPEPEAFAGAGGVGKEGEVSLSVSGPAPGQGGGGVGVGVDYVPFAPALELPTVEYQQTGSHVHTSSWPPNRDAPTWLIYTAFALGAVVTLVGNVPFGVAALVLAALGAWGRSWWGGRRWAIASAAVGSAGLLVALAGWAVLAAWLVRSAALSQKYCTEENYSWRTSQENAACQCAASSWNAVTMCCEYDTYALGNSTCCLTVYDNEDKSVETLCGGGGGY